MNQEFLGIGRTWLFVYLMSAGVTLGWLMQKISFQEWWQTIMGLGGLGGIKSTTELFTTKKPVPLADIVVPEKPIILSPEAKLGGE